jgi:hypothetical protein
VCNISIKKGFGKTPQLAREGKERAETYEVLKKEKSFVSASDLSDESLLRYYDDIRKQVDADRGNKHKFMTSDTIKAYAESLRLELYERRLSHAPIDWWTDQQPETVTPPKSDASDRLDPAPVAEASAAETAEDTTAESAEPAIIDAQSVEQLSDLKRRIDILIRGPDQTGKG